MGWRRLSALLGVGVVLLCLVAEASAKPTATTCADAAGAPFNFSIQNTHYAGDRYRVTVTNVDCSFARTWVSKLTRTASGPAHLAATHKMTGPSGWKCVGGGTPSAGHSSPTITGTCSVGSSGDPSKQFHWNIDAGQAKQPPVVNAG